jgi:hypothetical protein
MTPRKMQSGVIPPEANGDVVACLETVWETSAPPDDSRCPVVCLDAQPGQLRQATRVPIAAPKPPARRVDSEDERAGTASVCLVAEPLQGWRHVRLRAQRTTGDGALAMAALLRTRDAEAHTGLGVCNNFNTHTMGACSAAFAAERARQLGRRLAFRDTPTHGSWLHIAANALRALTRQWLHDRRCGETTQLAEDTAAGSTSSHAKQRGVDWPFTINDARTKLTSLYPKAKA